MKSLTLFFRNFTISFFILLLVCLPTLQAKAEQMSAFGSLAGKSGPVLTAVTTCTINLILSAITIKGKSLLQTVEGKAGFAINVDDSVAVKDAKNQTWLNDNRSAFHDFCLKPIAKAAAQVLLAFVTQETVEWINSGFNGKALYIQDLEGALKKLQTDALGNIIGTIGADEGKYPFGKATAISLLNSAHNTFEKSAQSDMQKLLDKQNKGYTSLSFGTNLTDGGWDAFNASFKANNNSVGFLLKTQDELSKKLAGTEYNPGQNLKDMVARGNGFIDQRACQSPANFNKFKDDPSKCKKWVTVTPGSVIGDRLKKALSSTNDTLHDAIVSGDDLNASITLIFDALMSEVAKEGLACVSGQSGNLWNCPSSSDYVDPNQDPDSGDNGDEGYVDDGSGGNTNTTQSDITGGSVCGQTSAGDWKNAYPRFDLLAPSSSTSTGLQGLIIKEEKFWMLVNQQNEVIKKIIPAIYQLDYCVPGPHPIDASAVSTITNDIMNKINVPGYDDPMKSGRYQIANHANFLNDTLALTVMPDSKIAKMNQVNKVVKAAVKNYIAAIKEEFRGNIYLSSYGQSVAEYNKIPYYEQTLQDNETKKAHTVAVISQLKMIQGRVDKLRPRKAKITVRGAIVDNPKVVMIQKMFDNIVPDLDVAPY